jgi:hypothetical protein
MRKLTFILLATLLVSFANANDIIISDKSYHISKDIMGKFTEFSFEFISDYENNLEGEYPNLDFVTIWVDVNANSKLDSKIDRYYGQAKNNACVGFLLTSSSSQPCGSFDSEAKVFHYFIKTEVNPMPHPVIKFLIPTSELITSNDGVYVVFTIHSSGNVTSYYPSKSAVETFSSTYKVRL